MEKYIILNDIELAQTRMQEIKSSATTDGNWLPQYDNLELTKLNQITNKGAFIYIEDLNTYYTAEEIISAELLSRDWFLLGMRQVILDITNCPSTGLPRKVFLRHLSIDLGNLQQDTTQPVQNQKIIGTYNIVILDNNGNVFKISQDMYQTITAKSLSKYDYYFGDGLYVSILDRFKEIFNL